MTRIHLIDPQATTDERKEILSQIHSAFGTVPNMFKAIANSSSALKMMWGAFGALSKGKLKPKLTEQIAVAIANANRCEYCLAAHTVLGKGAGASLEDMRLAQKGISQDPQTQAALTFALKLVYERANVSSKDIDSLKEIGFSEEEITEILAHVALNIFTNYTNVAFEVPVDFPKVGLIS